MYPQGKKKDVDLLGLAFIFLTIFRKKLRASCGPPQKCSATFHLHLLLLRLNPCQIISAVTALQAAAQIEVTCFLCPV